MERREVQPPDMPQDLAAIGKRLLDLERQVSAFRVPKIQDDLLDTEVLYQAPTSPGGPTPPGNGDVLTFDTTRDSPYGGLWVPGAAGSRHVAWTGTMSKTADVWGTPETVYLVAPGSDPMLMPVEAGDGTGGVIASVNVAGVWIVRGYSFQKSPYGGKLTVSSQSWSPPDDGACIANLASWDLEGTDLAERMSVPGVFWLPGGSDITVLTDATDVDIRSELLLYMETPIDVGTCGG